MTRRAINVLHVIVGSVFISVVGASAGAGNLSDQTAEIWANRHYKPCVTQLFVRPEANPQFRTSHGLIVTLRAIDDCGFERQLTLYSTDSGAVGAEIISVESPIRNQLATLHKTHPGADLSAICNHVNVKKISLEPQNKNAIATFLAELRDIQISPVLESIIFLHDIRYELWVTSVGNESYFAFSMPGFPRSSEEFSHPLDIWAQRLLRSLKLHCDASGSEE